MLAVPFAYLKYGENTLHCFTIQQNSLFFRDSGSGSSRNSVICYPHISFSVVATVQVVACRTGKDLSEERQCTFGCIPGSSDRQQHPHPTPLPALQSPWPPLQHSSGTALYGESLWVPTVRCGLSTSLLLPQNRDVFSTVSERSHLGHVWEQGGRQTAKNTSCSFWLFQKHRH